MSNFGGGDLRVARTGNGYVAVLRIQGAPAGVHGVGACSYEEARALVCGHYGVSGEDELAAVLGYEVGAFSFKKLARGIGNIASKIARVKALQSLVSLAGHLPPPVGTVASVANQALHVMRGMQSGAPAARAAWVDAAARARRDPHSPTAVGMRLALAANGPATFRTGARAAHARVVERAQGGAAELAREVADELSPPAPADTAPAAAGDDVGAEGRGVEHVIRERASVLVHDCADQPCALEATHKALEGIEVSYALDGEHPSAAEGGAFRLNLALRGSPWGVVAALKSLSHLGELAAE